MRFAKAAIGFALLVLLAGCGGPAAITEPRAFNGTQAPAFEVPSGQWMLSDGTSQSTEDLFDRPMTIVFFGFTHCDDVCPLTLNRISSAVRRLPEAQRDDVQVLMVTVDPERDNAAAMAKFLARIDPTFLGVTASSAQLHELADSLGVYFVDPKPGEEDYQVDHSAPVIGLQSRGPSMVWTGSQSGLVTVSDLSEDLAVLLDVRE